LAYHRQLLQKISSHDYRAVGERIKWFSKDCGADLFGEEGGCFQDSREGREAIQRREKKRNRSPFERADPGTTVPGIGARRIGSRRTFGVQFSEGNCRSGEERRGGGGRTRTQERGRWDSQKKSLRAQGSRRSDRNGERRSEKGLRELIHGELARKQA